jgi:hypothetical protein
MERILEGSYCTLEHYSYSVLNDMSLYIEGIHVDKRLRKGATVVVPYQDEVALACFRSNLVYDIFRKLCFGRL